MTWVGYFEDIEESQIESLKRDNRQLEIIGANATLNNEESKRYLQHAKCYHEAGQKIEHRLLEIVTHPDYSNVLLIPTIKRLEKELSDSNRVILTLREELHKSGHKNTRLFSTHQPTTRHGPTVQSDRKILSISSSCLNSASTFVGKT